MCDVCDERRAITDFVVLEGTADDQETILPPVVELSVETQDAAVAASLAAVVPATPQDAHSPVSSPPSTPPAHAPPSSAPSSATMSITNTGCDPMTPMLPSPPEGSAPPELGSGLVAMHHASKPFGRIRLPSGRVIPLSICGEELVSTACRLVMRILLTNQKTVATLFATYSGDGSTIDIVGATQFARQAAVVPDMCSSEQFLDLWYLVTGLFVEEDPPEQHCDSEVFAELLVRLAALYGPSPLMNLMAEASLAEAFTALEALNKVPSTPVSFNTTKVPVK